MLPGLNVVIGAITTGKTTFVHLLRGLLGSMPSGLPPEVDEIRALRGSLDLSGVSWDVYRPRTTTADAPVEVARKAEDARGSEPDAIRLKATGWDGSYSRFMLDQLHLPAVQVPEGSKDSPGRLSSVSMSDWLAYCVIPGDELDSQVFGSHDTWREKKRRWIFELVYGLYDVETAKLFARKRGIELKLEALEVEAEVIAKFLAQTPFESLGGIRLQIEATRVELEQVRNERRSSFSHFIPNDSLSQLRSRVLELRAKSDSSERTQQRLRTQLEELEEVKRQLVSQSARLTRAIVSEEWLVDFDFLVCPRCGNDVHRNATQPGVCYLCHQEEHPGHSQISLLVEQDRVVSQIAETDSVIERRESSLTRAVLVSNRLRSESSALSEQLDRRMADFVSDKAEVLQSQAALEATLEARYDKLSEYELLLKQKNDRASSRLDLETEIERIDALIEGRVYSRAQAEDNIKALESRMLTYLTQLHIPQLSDLLTVKINRKTYMPEVSGRSFSELSSQGLKTLVNCAHALAHHTVAIDRSLPLPGLLVLDGLSANSGNEGFDKARVDDLYRLLLSVSREYEGQLQLIAVDNEYPVALRLELADKVVLELSQGDRLIKTQEVF